MIKKKSWFYFMQQNRGNLKEKLVFVFFKMDFSENLPLEDV